MQPARQRVGCRLNKFNGKATSISEIKQADEARRLTASEQEAVNKTLQPAIAELSRPELQVLARRLREARDRARAIAS